MAAKTPQQIKIEEALKKYGMEPTPENIQTMEILNNKGGLTDSTLAVADTGTSSFGPRSGIGISDDQISSNIAATSGFGTGSVAGVGGQPIPIGTNSSTALNPMPTPNMDSLTASPAVTLPSANASAFQNPQVNSMFGSYGQTGLASQEYAAGLGAIPEGYDLNAGEMSALAQGRDTLMQSQATAGVNQSMINKDLASQIKARDVATANIGKVGMMDYANLGLSAFNAWGQHQANKTNEKSVNATIANNLKNHARRDKFEAGVNSSFATA